MPAPGDSRHEAPARCFLRSVGAMLLLTAVAKLVSGMGNSRSLLLPDPILVMRFRYVLLAAAAVELGVGLVCIAHWRTRLQAAAVAWLASCLLIYRMGLAWIDYRIPCSCLGNLTDALHISPKTADFCMKVVLAYMLCGSCGILLLQARRRLGTRIQGESGLK